MKRMKAAALAAAGLILLSFAACKKQEKEAGPAPSPTPQEVADPNWPVSLGDIRVEKKPDSVVCLSPAAADLVLELGGEAQVTGIGEDCGQKALSGLQKCGTAELPDFDALESVAPQVVFSTVNLTQDATARLQQMDCEVVVLPRAGSMEALAENYATAATVLGGMIDGAQLGRDTFTGLQARWEALTAAASGIAEDQRLSGIYLRAVPLVMATGDSFEGRLLEAIGVKNAAAEYTGWQYPEDKAVDLYPDVIFYDESIDLQYLKDTQVYNTTDAVKQDRCYAFDAIVFERQNAEMFDVLEKMFAQAYPEAAAQMPAISHTEEKETQIGEDEPSGDGASSEADESAGGEEMLTPPPSSPEGF